MVVAEIISFGDTVERLLEVMLVVLVGICLAIYWDWRAVPLAAALFFVICPLAALLFLVKTPTGRVQRLMMRLVRHSRHRKFVLFKLRAQSRFK